MVTFFEETLNAPKILADGEGLKYSLGPQHMTVKFTSTETGGSFCFAEIAIDEPGFGPPYHVHTLEDELFMVLEGSLKLVVDGREHMVYPGGVAYSPRNVPHRFESGPDGVRFQIMITGSNFERFHQRYADAMERGDMASLPQIGAEHGISFLPE